MRLFWSTPTASSKLSLPPPSETHERDDRRTQVQWFAHRARSWFGTGLPEQNVNEPRGRLYIRRSLNVMRGEHVLCTYMLLLSFSFFFISRQKMECTCSLTPSCLRGCILHMQPITSQRGGRLRSACGFRYIYIYIFRGCIYSLPLFGLCMS